MFSKDVCENFCEVKGFFLGAVRFEEGNVFVGNIYAIPAFQ